MNRCYSAVLLPSLLITTYCWPSMAAPCQFQHDVVIGSSDATYDRFLVKAVTDCCSRCQDDGKCVAFTFESDTSMCYLKSSSSTKVSKSGAISGIVGSASTSFNLTLSETVVSTTLPTYKSWNIDSSADRQFFTRNLSNPELHYLAKYSMPGLLRFGGTGNDDLVYAFGNTTCGNSPTCLNQSWFDNLMDFANEANAPVIFGLSIKPRRTDDKGNKVWDPTNARQLLTYAIQAGYTFYGFELGNEQNNDYHPEQEASDFVILQDLIVSLWPDESHRPKILGPDPHSMRTGSSTESTIRFLKEFALNCSAKGVDLYALTHHEYIEVDVNSSFDGNYLDNTAEIAIAVNATLSQAAPNVLRFAGEIGPHNGGSPPCDHTSMRWATFADSFWYMDSLAAKARHGYAAHCRQNFIGIDYGLLDCSTNQPLPDYYAGILWGATMGTKVLSVTVSDRSHNVRGYAHCSASNASPLVQGWNPKPGQVTLLLLNLNTASANISLPRVLGTSTYTAFRLTQGSDGVAGQSLQLNGDVLEYSTMKLPTMSGTTEPASPLLVMAPQSIGFFVFDVELAACT
eukprot:m.31844 g.31844  ORF g.31844 m.31844 type:complete len:570 (+) comp12107_c0_seq1:2-1711(+)